MIEYIVLITIIIAFTIASIEDIKKREVYDYINFSLAFFILIVSIFHSLIISSIDPFKYVTFGMLLGFAFGAFLFYFGVWGGGDAKFLLGFGASSYYLVSFLKNEAASQVGLVYNYGLELLSGLFTYLIKISINWILIIDLIFVLLVIVQFFLTKRKVEKKDLIFLLLVLGVLFLGLFINFSPLITTTLGFIAFILIFFAREGIFGSVYIKYKKHLEDLKHGDRIDEDIVINHKKVIEYVYDKKGLTKEEINLLRDCTTSHNKYHDVMVKIPLPYSTLVALNFIMYLFKVISLDSQNLIILSFMFKFLFFSFIAGGILAVFVVFYYFFKNYHSVNLNMKKLDYSIIVLILILALVLLVSKFNYYVYVFLLVPLYVFVKMALSIENVAFIKNKKLEDITLGDWIVQDIKIGNRTVYDVSDFKIGVDEFQLKKIKDLAKKHPELSRIKVKDGIAFIPALYVGFILVMLI